MDTISFPQRSSDHGGKDQIKTPDHRGKDPIKASD